MVINHHALYCSFGYHNFNMPKMEEKTSVVPLQRNLILINAEGLKTTGLRMTFSGSLMEKNGYLESCHQLNPNNGIKQLENQQNPCLLDVYIYSLICLNLEMRTCDYIVSVLISFSLSCLSSCTLQEGRGRVY